MASIRLTKPRGLAYLKVGMFKKNGTKSECWGVFGAANGLSLLVLGAKARAVRAAGGSQGRPLCPAPPGASPLWASWLNPCRGRRDWVKLAFEIRLPKIFRIDKK